MVNTPASEMPKAYDPEPVEGRWYALWEEAGSFRPEVNESGEPFCIVIPPPNVTGSLHMGHAFEHSLIDATIRRKRMQGYAALWLPGTDHAGIATQNVVERELAKEGLDRHEIGREGFVERVWGWKAEQGGRITQQMRKMGSSCDWTRERFTMDEGCSRAVRVVFVRLYDEGLIYRANRIINWCPRCHTALSDIEVEHEDVDGELVHIRYPFADGDGSITVATTRAETMLGDTGVAVHPDDERYAGAIGRTLILPLVGREIPVVADTAVDPEFGTGAVKVTPAHDPNDFEIAARTNLPAVDIFTESAVVNENGGRFAGLARYAARDAVKEALRREGLLEGIDEHRHAVGHCYRCHTVVEPRLSLQWFVKSKPLAEPAAAAVADDRTQFVPENWEKLYFDWLENLRDWCVSRQIWWGHRIPAWYCRDCGRVIVSVDDPTSCSGCMSADLTQDEDVLDTWFSSALWPFTTLGWPEQTDDLEPLLSQRHAPHRVRHHLLLGRPDDADGPALPGRRPVPGGGHPRPGARRRGPQDVEVLRQRGRPARAGRPLRRRRPALRPHPGGEPRPRRPPGRGVGGGRPQLRQQAVELGPVRGHEPRRPAAWPTWSGPGSRPAS